MKFNKTVVFLIIAVVLAVMMNIRLSRYDNECNDTKTFEEGWRCFKDDESSFSQGVKKCENCKTKWKMLPKA